MQVSTVEVKMARGQVVIQANGRTPTGRKFIKASRPLKCQSISDPKFKAEMAAVVNELLESDSLAPQ